MSDVVEGRVVARHANQGIIYASRNSCRLHINKQDQRR